MELRIENLTKSYAKQKAIDAISFQLKSGEVLGFLGPNGAGKSTTMRIISCYMAPDRGAVFADDVSVFDDPESFKLQIGYLPENNPLYKDMYVIDYLKFIGRIQKIPAARGTARIKELIDYTGLHQEIHKKIGALSKGYKQRVGLAQALIHDPEILILDEPTSGLDPNQILEIRELIRSLGREKTILLSTHILQEVEATCDRIIIINKGKIVADASPETLRTQMEGRNIIAVQIECNKAIHALSKELKSMDTIEDIEVISEKDKRLQLFCQNSYQAKKDVFNLCVKNNWFLLEMKESETKLEDIFRKLTSVN
jgi:ABC-2 type transport system ATP-binding protein